MLTPIANIHHHVMPAPGSIGYITSGWDRYGHTLYWHGRKRKCIVESYRLTDNLPEDGIYLALGIHTCNVRFLDNGETDRFSGFWFTSETDIT